MSRTGYGKSDVLIVVKKYRKLYGAKGHTKGQFMIIILMQEYKTDMIKNDYDKVKDFAFMHPGLRIRSLSWRINSRNLIGMHQGMDKNKARGIDGIAKDDYAKNLEVNISFLVERLKRETYNPKPTRRTYIPKLNGKMRPLGISCYEDKLVEGCVALILSSVYESRFMDFSYGFRPAKSCHQAIGAVREIITTGKINWIVEADIKSFFDTVDHEQLIKFLELDIEDKKFIRLKFLKAGIMEEGKILTKEEGTPQGNAMSPMLANVYLHYVLDLWFEQTVKKYCRGEAYIVRYADDFVCMFQNKSDAERYMKALNLRMKKYHLSLEPTKTNLLEFGRFAIRDAKCRGKSKPETFNFLGFTFYCSQTRNNKFTVKVKTDRKKVADKLKRLTKWLYDHRNLDIKEIFRRVNLSLTGHFNYYGITSNYRSINNFREKVIRIIFKILNRRSQRKSFTWEKFSKLLKVMPIAKAKICSATPQTLRLFGEPYEGNLQVRF